MHMSQSLLKYQDPNRKESESGHQNTFSEIHCIYDTSKEQSINKTIKHTLNISNAIRSLKDRQTTQMHECPVFANV